MNNTTTLPAIPGTRIIWFNHCTNTTHSEPVLFWGAVDEDDETHIDPFVLLDDFAIRFDLPTNKDIEGESCVIAYDIPGYGRIELGEDHGYSRSISGFKQDFS
jgi:hypothetical protein